MSLHQQQQQQQRPQEQQRLPVHAAEESGKTEIYVYILLQWKSLVEFFIVNISIQ